MNVVLFPDILSDSEPAEDVYEGYEGVYSTHTAAARARALSVLAVGPAGHDEGNQTCSNVV